MATPAERKTVQIHTDLAQRLPSIIGIHGCKSEAEVIRLGLRVLDNLTKAEADAILEGKI